MKIVPYEGAYQWRNQTSFEEKDFTDYLQASEKLNQVIDYFYEIRNKDLKKTIQKCESFLGNHFAHPIVISHPSLLSRNCSYDGIVPDMKYSFSAVTNNCVVQKAWTFGELQQPLEQVIEFAIKQLNPGVKISDWCQEVEDKLKSLNLFAVSDTYGYESTKNIPLMKSSTGLVQENGIYVVRIQCKNKNEEPKIFSKGSGYYIWNDKRETIKLSSSKKIYFEMKPRKQFGFCNRHVEHIPSHAVGLKELCDKKILQEIPLVWLEGVKTGEVTKTILVKPNQKLIL